MSDVDGSDKDDLEQTNSKLSQSLKSCRLIMNSYRVLLASEIGSTTDGAPASAGMERANDP